MNRSHRQRVLVIGGGVAGASCALMLARQNIQVDLVEKTEFPRAKVCGCCIGPAGLKMLDRMELKETALQQSLETSRWVGSFGGRQVDVPIPHGIAISREVLDPLILHAAKHAGVNVTMNCTARVTELTDNDVEAEIQTDQSSVRQRYDLVVAAAGLTGGGLDAFLPWQEAPHGPFGVSCSIDSCRDNPSIQTDAIQTGTIYMACGDDGYVGIVRLSDSVIDIAAALRSGGQARQLGNPVDRMQRMIDQSGFDLPNLQNASALMTTPKLRRTRTAGKGRLIAIGDAAGYVEPFTGEGMTWAMQSAVAASELIASPIDRSVLGQRWQKRSADLLKRKKRVCRLVTNACRSRLMRASAAKTLHWFPALAKPIVASISRV